MLICYKFEFESKNHNMTTDCGFHFVTAKDFVIKSSHACLV